MTRPFITNQSYNQIRDKIQKILGNFSDTFGYGQTLVSSPVVKDQDITRRQWLNLRDDLISIKNHQEGSFPNIPEPSGVISLDIGQPAELYERLIDELTETRFNVGKSNETTKVISTYTQFWSTTATFLLSITFNNSDDARRFFNSGGKIKFRSSRSGGDDTDQNRYWTNTLNTVGDVIFGADTVSLVNYYTLTDGFQTFYFSSPDPAYPDNSFRIDAKCNVSNNSTGTATQVDFRVRWIDGYTNPTLDSFGDRVGGTLTCTVSELTTDARLFNDGKVDQSRSWNISGPGYTQTPISAPAALPLPPTRTYAIVADKSNVDEGDIITFNITTTSFPNGSKLYYTVTSINPNLDTNDFLDPISGEVIVVGGTAPTYLGTASVVLRIREDKKSEGNEIATFSLRAGSVVGPILTGGNQVSFNIIDTSKPEYQIFASPTSIREGGTVNFTVTTTNVPNNTIISWNIVGTQGTINEFDFEDQTLIGQVLITNNVGTIPITIAQDKTTEGIEKFKIVLSEISISNLPSILAESTEITIQDSSLTAPVGVTITAPSDINEGDTLIVQIKIENFSVPTILYYKINTFGNFNSADIFTGLLNGSIFVDANGDGNFVIIINNDVLTEGNETFSISIFSDENLTQLLKTSSLITVRDTSQTSTYNLVVNPTTANEGSTVLATINTTDVSNGTQVYWRVQNGTVNASDFIGSTQGSVIINSNTASFSLTINDDLTTEGIETYGIQLSSNSEFSVLLFDSGALYSISDTSTTPPPTTTPPPPPPQGLSTTPGGQTVGLGSTAKITITPINIPLVQQISYTLQGPAVENGLILGNTSGSFVNTGSPLTLDISIVPTATVAQLSDFGTSFTLTASTSGVPNSTSGAVTILPPVRPPTPPEEIYTGNEKVFIVDEVYQIPAGCKTFDLYIAGGGGGGGGGVGSPNNQNFSAGGGGGSGAAISILNITRTSLMNTITVTVGIGGNGGAAGTDFAYNNPNAAAKPGQNGTDTVVIVQNGSSYRARGGFAGIEGNMPGQRQAVGFSFRNGGTSGMPAGSNGTAGFIEVYPRARGGNGGPNFITELFPDGNTGQGQFGGGFPGNNNGGGGGGGGGGIQRQNGGAGGRGGNGGVLFIGRP